MDFLCFEYFHETEIYLAFCVRIEPYLWPMNSYDLDLYSQSLNNLQVLVADPFENPVVQSLYNEWLEKPGSEKARQLMHTEYHPIVKSITSQLHNW